MEIDIDLTDEEKEFLSDYLNLPDGYPKTEVKTSFRDTDKDAFSKRENSVSAIAKIDFGSILSVPIRTLVVCGCCESCIKNSLIFSRILSKLIEAVFLKKQK